VFPLSCFPSLFLFFFTVQKFIAQLTALKALELSVLDERANSLADLSTTFSFFNSAISSSSSTILGSSPQQQCEQIWYGFLLTYWAQVRTLRFEVPPAEVWSS
jgi:hypothetical protein